MDIIKRNFFRLLRSGSLNEYESLEPMSAYKWNRLLQLLKVQGVVSIALRGVKNHQYDDNMNLPANFMQLMLDSNDEHVEGMWHISLDQYPVLTNTILGKRLRKIVDAEVHAIDTSTETLTLLGLIVGNISHFLNKGISLRGILELGRFLRTKGDKVDFVKLDDWLSRLHIQRMAQLEGSILFAVFNFDLDELPFVHTVEPQAYALTLRSLYHTTIDTSREWHFRQTRSGFVHNNSSVLRRNLRRSFRYMNYAPIETTSNFVHNFTKSLSEIEE